MKAFISLREKNPEAADMWIYDEYYNGEKTPENVEWYSKKNARFRCPNNKDHIFIKMILYMGDKNSRFYGCDICKKESSSISNPTDNRKRPLIDESHQEAVSVQYDEELVKRKSEWSNNNPFDISLYSDSSEYPAKWICRTCSKEYVQRISEHLTGIDNCPYCRETSNRKNNVENRLPTLDVVYPEIARELSDKSPFKANVLLCDMPIMCTWVCGKCHGEYPARVNERTSKDFQCPYCSGAKKYTREIYGYSIVDKYKELLNEWDYEKNYLMGNPSDIYNHNKIPYWWKCPKCKYSYHMNLSMKKMYFIRHKESCPYCKGLRQEHYHLY